MKRIKDIAIAVCISPEVVIILFCLFLYHHYPELYQWIGARVSARADVIKYFCFIPVGLLVLSLKIAFPLLFPGDKEMKILQAWPKYHMLKDRYVISLLFIAGCSVASIAVWALNLPVPDARFIAVIIGSILISCITYALLFFAQIRVKEILLNAGSDGEI